MNMDALTHTILAVALLAVAYYGGRALQVREARRMWGDIATPAMKREIELMDALIKHMSREDDQSVTTERDQSPLQLELFSDTEVFNDTH
jgi:hypothetical protein